MQKIINVIAVTSFVLSASTPGAGLYLYMNRETLIEQVKRELVETLVPKGVKDLQEKLPIKLPVKFF